MRQQNTIGCTWQQLVRYFLWLGATGFGGPIALIGYMQQDLVQKRGWITQDEYTHGLALAQICPGPISTQLAIYFGWIRGGFVGATSVAIAYTLPSFLMCLALAVLYMHNQGLVWLQSALHGISAAVIAIIARSSISLSRLTCKSNYLLWGLFGITFVVTPFIAMKVGLVMIACGFAFLIINTSSKSKKDLHNIIVPLATSIFTKGYFANSILLKIGLSFACAGALIFGSGLAILPFLHSFVVDKYQWLTERQFLDAVAIGMITPGPVIITAAFIGFLTAGFLGGLVAIIAITTPCYLFVLMVTPLYQRVVQNARVHDFISGVTAAAAGAIGSAAFLFGEQVLTDIKAIGICTACAVVIFCTKRIPEPLVIILAGIVNVNTS